MEQTALMGIPYPAEDEDPFWDTFVAFVETVDAIELLQKIRSNLFVGGGGVRNWNGGTGVFTWTDDFVVPVYHWGRKILIRFGPDGVNRSLALQDGQALMITIPTIMNGNVNVNFSVVNQLDPTRHDQWIVGWRCGSALQLRGVGEIL